VHGLQHIASVQGTSLDSGICSRQARTSSTFVRSPFVIRHAISMMVSFSGSSPAVTHTQQIYTYVHLQPTGSRDTVIAAQLRKQHDRTGNPAVRGASQQYRHLVAGQGRETQPRRGAGKAALQNTVSQACNGALSAPPLPAPCNSDSHSHMLLGAPNNNKTATAWHCPAHSCSVPAHTFTMPWFSNV
jgi:hypothetical protein